MCRYLSKAHKHIFKEKSADLFFNTTCINNSIFVGFAKMAAKTEKQLHVS